MRSPGTERLKAEGWGYTILEAIAPVQTGPDKIHVAEQDGHWDVQFRSSYLGAD